MKRFGQHKVSGLLTLGCTSINTLREPTGTISFEIDQESVEKGRNKKDLPSSLSHKVTRSLTVDLGR